MPLSAKTDGLHSIIDFIRWAYSRFNEAELFYGHGTDNGWDESVQLVLAGLHLPWDFDQKMMSCALTESEKAVLTDLIKRRVVDRTPVPYLVNQAWFCGQPYYVDERVLVPRSPIAELITQGFEPWLANVQVDRVMDLCTGSGCIGIACAQLFEEAHVDLVDISAEALQVSMINIDKHEVLDRVRCIESDLLDQVPEQTYQLIVSNPPYVDLQDLNDMPEEFHHEPELGLAAGVDGLDLCHKILAKAADYLSADGLLVVEVGNSQWALQDVYPQVPFIWVEFEFGGDGVFVLTAEQVREYRPLFEQQVAQLSI